MRFSFYIFALAIFLAHAEELKPPLGLPPVPWPSDNPYTREKAELGRLLFFDTRLSSDQTVSYASCHHKGCAFSDCRRVALGIESRMGRRHSPSIINAAYAHHLFWDGRASSLEEQCKGPIANTKEMTLISDIHDAHRKCEERVRSIPGYAPLFKRVFGHDQITLDEIAKAIATFERTILSGNSAFDRFRAGDKLALSEEEQQGWQLFKSKGCIHCHGDFNFSDNRFINIGIGMDAPIPDPGRFAITLAKRDWGAFKVPTLREVANTAPYMHDGSLETLEEVIEYYDDGGNKNLNLHPLIRPLKLTEKEKEDLVSFLKSLSGEGWQHFQEPTQFPK